MPGKYKYNVLTKTIFFFADIAKNVFSSEICQKYLV